MDKATEIQVYTLNMLFIESLYSRENEVSDNDIIDLLDFFTNAASDNLPALDLTLPLIDVDRLAPIFAVGIARALFTLRHHFSNWTAFVARARDCFIRRGLDADELLQGLTA